MAVNKVVYGTTVLVDLTADRVSPATLLRGVTAHDAAGESITGTYEPGESTVHVETGEITLSSNSRTISITGSFVPAHILLFADTNTNTTSGAIRMASSLDMVELSCKVLTAASLAIGIGSVVNTSINKNGTITRNGKTVTLDSGSNSRLFVRGNWRYIIWRDDTAD